MDYIQAAILAVIQGLTEFLPISSSAHLILPPKLFGWEDQGLAFDVAVHIGSLLAVILYFRQEIMGLISAWFAHVFQKKMSSEAKIAWFIILATIPAGLVGLAFKSYIELYLRSPLVIAITTIIFGLALWWADRYHHKADMTSLTWKKVLFIGVAQAFALIPGTSRSGVTMTAGLMMGLNRIDCAKFSFYMSIPIIVLSGLLSFFDLVNEQVAVNWGFMLSGIALSFVSALVCIHLFLSAISKMGMLPFVIYRLVLGAILLFIFL
jgi:undecaprenyl-diphosphatase